MALIAIAMACGLSARAEETEYDPAKVSESLKAIFQFGSVATKQALNANTVTLMSGRSAAPMCSSAPTSLPCSTTETSYAYFRSSGAVGAERRRHPVPARRRPRHRPLRHARLSRAQGFAKDIKKQFTYVTKLYNEEMHVIALEIDQTLQDLEGKTVSVDLPNGGTFVTALTVFERLGMKPKVVYIEQRIAMEKMKAGEIDAVIVCGGKPYKSVSGFKDDRFHLVTVNYEKPLQNGLSAGQPVGEGLSQSDFGRGARRHHRGAGGARRL
jgi:hypothetical protein